MRVAFNGYLYKVYGFGYVGSLYCVMIGNDDNASWYDLIPVDDPDLVLI